MAQISSVRIDKFIWSVRIFKSRSIASEACKKGNVLINDSPVKASRSVSVGDIISARKNPVLYKYKVIQLLQNRVGAKLVADYVENQTPKEELDKLEMMKLDFQGKRERGKGRPTKKERRDIERLS